MEKSGHAGGMHSSHQKRIERVQDVVLYFRTLDCNLQVIPHLDSPWVAERPGQQNVNGHI
jgi:hypothetical protein